jgi:hypothetical protein
MSAIVGAAWIVVGSIGLIDYALRAWRAWAGLGNFPAALRTFGPWGVISIIAILAGIGILGRQNWARIIAAILSPILLILGIFVVATLPFYGDEMLTSAVIIRAVIIAVLTIPLGTCTIHWFFKDQRLAEKKAQS